MVIMQPNICIKIPRGSPKLTNENGIETIPPPIIVANIAKIPVNVVSPCSPTNETRY